MSHAETVYLGLGTNMGDRKAHLDAALEAISRLFGTSVLAKSPIYESKPWGPVEQADYLNIAVKIATGLEPEELLEQCKAIEREQGRVPGERWGPRPLDVDILLYGNEQIQREGLTIPHPRMWERAFVLRPLADLAPELHSPDGTPILELLQRDDIASQGVWLYHQS